MLSLQSKTLNKFQDIKSLGREFQSTREYGPSKNKYASMRGTQGGIQLILLQGRGANLFEVQRS